MAKIVWNPKWLSNLVISYVAIEHGPFIFGLPLPLKDSDFPWLFGSLPADKFGK